MLHILQQRVRYKEPTAISTNRHGLHPHRAFLSLRNDHTREMWIDATTKAPSGRWTFKSMAASLCGVCILTMEFGESSTSFSFVCRQSGDGDDAAFTSFRRVGLKFVGILSSSVSSAAASFYFCRTIDDKTFTFAMAQLFLLCGRGVPERTPCVRRRMCVCIWRAHLPAKYFAHVPLKYWH